MAQQERQSSNSDTPLTNDDSTALSSMISCDLSLLQASAKSSCLMPLEDDRSTERTARQPEQLQMISSIWQNHAKEAAHITTFYRRTVAVYLLIHC